MAEGVRIRHTGGVAKGNTLYVVENPRHRYSDGGYDCPRCVGVHHYAKATHLWLEPDGACIVSTCGHRGKCPPRCRGGVLEELYRAGFPNLTVVGVVAEPPTLRIGKGAEREKVDNENRAIVVLQHIEQLGA